VATQGIPTLELAGVSKSFGAVVALRDGRLRLMPGSIHALVGENGAGKSTLVKIIAGLYQRDAGTMTLEGRPVDFRSTAEAKAAGIAVIYQEPTLFPDLSVTENVFMGRQPVGRFGRIDKTAMRAEVVSLLDRLGVRMDPDRPTELQSHPNLKGIISPKALATGAIKGAEGDKFTAGKLKEFTVGANGTVLLGEPYRFNKANIDNFNF
jgi:rhamnose transport system ATP-binding protein